MSSKLNQLGQSRGDTGSRQTSEIYILKRENDELKNTVKSLKKQFEDTKSKLVV
jgi:malate/lactate dehydrogenase